MRAAEVTGHPERVNYPDAVEGNAGVITQHYVRY
jgi:hypothetical protein